LQAAREAGLESFAEPGLVAAVALVHMGYTGRAAEAVRGTDGVHFVAGMGEIVEVDPMELEQAG